MLIQSRGGVGGDSSSVKCLFSIIRQSGPLGGRRVIENEHSNRYRSIKGRRRFNVGPALVLNKPPAWPWRQLAAHWPQPSPPKHPIALRRASRSVEQSLPASPARASLPSPPASSAPKWSIRLLSSPPAIPSRAAPQYRAWLKVYLLVMSGVNQGITGKWVFSIHRFWQ